MSYEEVLLSSHYAHESAKLCHESIQKYFPDCKNLLVSGTSGLVPAVLMREKWDYNFGYVRKDEETAHGGGGLVVSMYRFRQGHYVIDEKVPAVIIDDFVSGATTLERIMNYARDYQIEVLGAILYAELGEQAMEESIKFANLKGMNFPILYVNGGGEILEKQLWGRELFV